MATLNFSIPIPDGEMIRVQAWLRTRQSPNLPANPTNADGLEAFRKDMRQALIDGVYGMEYQAAAAALSVPRVNAT